MIATRHPIAVARFIKEKNPTIQEYYDFVTQNGTDFSYDVNTQGYLESTALFHACISGNFDLVKALINMGADVNSEADNATTPLYHAIQNGHFDIIKILIESGAELNDEFGNQFGHDSFSEEHNFDLFNNPKKQQELNGYIYMATVENKKEIAEYLIQVSSTKLEDLIKNKYKYDPEYYKACHLAAKDPYIHQDLVDEIEGSDNEQRRIKRKNLYHQIFSHKLNIKDAIEKNDLKKLASLLNDGPYVDLKRLGINYDSLLLVIVNQGNLEMLKLSVKHGLNIHERGISMIDIARNNGHHDVADYLRDLQISRYQQLQHDADLQTQKIKSTLFIKGMFFDTNSNLHQGLAQHLNEKDAGDMTKCILRKM